MWRRRFSEGRRGYGLSYGTAVLLVSGAILLFLYLTGRLNF